VVFFLPGDAFELNERVWRKIVALERLLIVAMKNESSVFFIM
jgi:hypothetical protein